MRTQAMKQYLDSLDGMKPGNHYVRVLKRAIDNPKSLRFAIVANCCGCAADFDDFGAPGRVKDCAIKSCGMWHQRPYQGGEEDEGSPDGPEETVEEGDRKADGPRFDPVSAAKAKPESLRKAINAHCWQCMGGGKNRKTQQLIRGCEVVICPLHHVRPYRDRASAT